jgi:hypothetical protein
VTTPPPPQGQNPYAQGQPPQSGNPFAQGQPPQGYPQQPGQPGVGIIVGGWLIHNDSEDAKKLAVGDCLYNKGTANDPDVVQVDCADSKATHKVLKKADGASLPSLTCQNVTGTTATLTWTETGESFTLCLGSNK